MVSDVSLRSLTRQLHLPSTTEAVVEYFSLSKVERVTGQKQITSSIFFKKEWMPIIRYLYLNQIYSLAKYVMGSHYHQ